jgi:NADH-quinone oxidoreductase subunit H
MVSYEIAMGLSIIALLMMTGTLSLREISEQQAGMNWNVLPIFYNLFDLCFCRIKQNSTAECETELMEDITRIFINENGILFAEYANMFISSHFSGFILWL